MDDAALKKIRGMKLISGQPFPSVVWGLKKHHVTYKGFGSYYDYRSYAYVGSEYSSEAQYFSYQGQRIYYGGDQWLADTAIILLHNGLSGIQPGIVP